MIRSSNKPVNQPPVNQQPPQQINTSQNKSSNNPQPIVLPSNNSAYQPPNNSQNFKTNEGPKNITNNLPPKPNEVKEKKKIFQK